MIDSTAVLFANKHDDDCNFPPVLTITDERTSWYAKDDSFIRKCTECSLCCEFVWEDTMIVALPELPYVKIEDDANVSVWLRDDKKWT